MRPTPLRSTAVATLLAMAAASLPVRAEPVAELSRSPVLQASPTLAAMVSDFGKARRAASTPLAAETPAAPAETPPPPKKSHKKTWIIVGVILGVVAIVALASGGDDGGGGGY